MKVYIYGREDGQYSDYSSTNLGVAASLETAQHLVEEQFIGYPKANWKKDGNRWEADIKPEKQYDSLFVFVEEHELMGWKE